MHSDNLIDAILDQRIEVDDGNRRLKALRGKKQ